MLLSSNLLKNIGPWVTSHFLAREVAFGYLGTKVKHRHAVGTCNQDSAIFRQLS